MDIYLTKDGKSVGPFTPDELRKKIEAGEADPDESAWSAETGDWKRLTLVLEGAESAKEAPAPDVRLHRFGAPPPKPDEGEADSKKKRKKDKKKKDKPPPEPERQRTSKLKPVGGPPPGVPSEGRKKGKGKGPAPIRAMGSRGAGKSKPRKGGAGFSVLRWVAPVAVLVFLFSIFMPWVTVLSENGQTELSAMSYVTAKPEKVSLPGSDDAPKYFRSSKLILMGTALVALIVGALSLLGALNPRGKNTMPAVLALAAAAASLVFGVIQDRAIEGQFNRALERAAAIEGRPAATVDFALDAGLFIGVGALVLAAAFLLAPRGGRSPLAFFLLVAVGVGLGGWGVKAMGARSDEVLKDAFADLKEKSKEVGGVVKEKIDELEKKLEDADGAGTGAAPGGGGTGGGGGGGEDPFN